MLECFQMMLIENAIESNRKTSKGTHKKQKLKEIQDFLKKN